MITKIISGGQTGADQGGLEAAEKLGITTGGFIPKGFLTETGMNPIMGGRYDLTETESKRYPPRTALNVYESDGTIWFGHITSTGFKSTHSAIRKYEKPLLVITSEVETKHVTEWIKENKIEVLNIAGNRESKNKGIQKLTKEYLVGILGAND